MVRRGVIPNRACLLAAAAVLSVGAAAEGGLVVSPLPRLHVTTDEDGPGDGSPWISRLAHTVCSWPGLQSSPAVAPLVAAPARYHLGHDDPAGLIPQAWLDALAGMAPLILDQPHLLCLPPPTADPR